MIQNTTVYFNHWVLPGISGALLLFVCKSRRLQFSLLVSLIFCNVYTATSQTQQHQPGKLLASIHSDFNAADLCRRFNATHPETNISCEKKVSDLLNTWLFSCDADAPAEQMVLRWLRMQPEIRFAQHDFKVTLRSTSTDSLIPNDPLFFQQWQYLNNGAAGGLPNADLDAPQAWDVSTGGTSIAQDTIVIAVIDGGIDNYHSDIKYNLWKNHAEVPNDNIDNDNNGYTDDFRGWNVWTQSDQIATWNNTHGTPVCGIIGARGNNGTGVSGVNWNVKIMFVAGSGFLSNLLESFDYVYKSRKRYNETQGQQGAFVVALNCSWGIDYGHPDDAPLLCAVFDTLGQEGILSIASTANLAINVDVEGDLPTTCPSPYLITVTSMTSGDQLASNAAWGPVSIDLGAYGSNVFTTAAGNNYGYFSGTSFAAPHVSGAVGLAYASDCPDLIALAKAEPQAGALMAKAILLNNTVYNNNLAGKVLTDGRLNLATLMEQQQSGCSSCAPPFDIKLENANATSAGLSWLQLPGQTNTMLRWKKNTDSLWQYQPDVSSPWTLTGLDTCATYTVGLSTLCNGENSGWSFNREFSTTGCCLAPEGLNVSGITAGGAVVNWSPVEGAGTYVVNWMTLGGYDWNTTTVSEDSSMLYGLLPCTEYIVKVGVLCGPDSFLFTPDMVFSTLGCGTCTDLTYCTAGAQSSIYEWITSVSINTWENESGNGGPGYENFTEGLSITPIIPVGTPFDLTLTPGFWGNPSKVYFRVYLDLNTNGSFDDPGELLFDPGYSTYNTISTSLLLNDATTTPVNTRLRVVMKYMGTFDTAPGPCELFSYGQVEDYCVDVGEINTSVFSNAKYIHGELVTWPVPANDVVWFIMPDTQAGCSKLSLDVLDVYGKRVMHKKFTPAEHKNGKVRLDTTTWLPGMYTLRLQAGERTFLGKAIKM